MSLPYFPFYPKDFQAKTAHLDACEVGIYLRMLMLQWQTPGGTLPNDKAWIERKAQARTEAEKAAVVAVMEEFFEVKGDRIANPRMAQEQNQAVLAHKAKVEAGRKGGLAKGKTKQLKNNGFGSSKAKAGLKQPRTRTKNPQTPTGGLKKSGGGKGRVPRIRTPDEDAVANAADEMGLRNWHRAWLDHPSVSIAGRVVTVTAPFVRDQLINNHKGRLNMTALGLTVAEPKVERVA